MKPRIAITLGDPAGIGPEIVAKALRDPRVRRACEPLVLGNPSRVPMGRPSRTAGEKAIKGLKEGLALVQSGLAKAIVTAPVSKESFQMADYGFPGHTEWFAVRCHAPHVAMLMVAGPLRAILMTRHIPIAQVPKHLSEKLIKDSARLGFNFLHDVIPRGSKRGIHHDGSRPRTGDVPRWGRLTIRRDDTRQPRIVLCGLNPHAGDQGLIGKEEQKIFLPAMRSLRKEGIPVAGPTPADTAFLQMAKGQYDLALAAYHDQGMIPLKLFAAERMVNITLGLPFIRTSPAHGTAYDIAGKTRADARPMIEAILLAAQYSS